MIKRKEYISDKSKKWILGQLQFSSVTQSCPPLCDPMDCSTPGLPIHPSSWSLLRLCPLSR